MANKKLFPTNFVPTEKREKSSKGKGKPKSEPIAPAPEPTATPEIPATEAAVAETAPAAEPQPEPIPEEAKPHPKAKPIKIKATKVKVKKLSMIQAAQEVLKKANTAMTCTDMIEAMASKGLWSSPAGKTPSNTLYAAISRLIKDQGKQAPFIKPDKGIFALNPKAKA